MNKTTLSRALRIGIGIWFIAAGIINGSAIWIAGLIPLYSGIANKCPSFFPGGSSSCDIEPPKKIPVEKIEDK